MRARASAVKGSADRVGTRPIDPSDQSAAVIGVCVVWEQKRAISDDQHDNTQSPSQIRPIGRRTYGTPRRFVMDMNRSALRCVSGDLRIFQVMPVTFLVQ